jgi:hypothetical protein
MNKMVIQIGHTSCVYCMFLYEKSSIIHNMMKCAWQQHRRNVMPIVRMEGGEVESLAPTRAPCRFSPCRPTCGWNAFGVFLLQSVADTTQTSCSRLYVFLWHPLAVPVLCNDKASALTVLEITPLHGTIQFRFDTKDSAPLMVVANTTTCSWK